MMKPIRHESFILCQIREASPSYWYMVRNIKYFAGFLTGQTFIDFRAYVYSSGQNFNHPPFKILIQKKNASLLTKNIINYV